MASLVRLHTRPPSHPQLQRWGNKSSWQECMEVYKKMHHPQTALTLTSKHDISPSCYERYSQYVPCVLVDLPGWGSRSIESPPAWLRLLAGGRITSSTVSGRNLLKLNQTFTICNLLSSFCHPLKPCNLTQAHHSFLWQFWWAADYFGSCYKLAGHWALGRPPLPHRSLTLGQYWWAHGSTPHQLSSSTSVLHRISLSHRWWWFYPKLVKIWCIVRWDRVMRN